MISIAIEFPRLFGRRVRGGLQGSITALEHNLKSADEAIAKAITDAIRDASLETKAMAISELTSEIGGNADEVRARVKSEKVTRFRARGTVFISGKRIPLSRFKRTQTAEGVKVRVGARSRVYKSAFGPNIPRLGGNVFRRQTKNRLPIRKVPGVSLTKIAKSTGLVERLRYHLRNQSRIKIKDYLVYAALGLRE